MGNCDLGVAFADGDVDPCIQPEISFPDPISRLELAKLCY
jgi:hypothetical protein